MEAILARLHDSAEKPFDEIVDIALLIKEMDATQRHIGILYKDPDDTDAVAMMLDLQWHHILGARAVRAGTGYFWAVPSVEPEIAYVLAKLCAKIAAKYAYPRRGIAYALRYAGERFDTQAGVFMNEEGRGLTCA